MGKGWRLAISQWTGSAAFVLLLVIVALSPLPFGSNGPESTVILVGLSGLTLLSAALGAALDSKVELPARVPLLTAAVACYLVFAAWALIQTVPGLPFGLPHPLWDEAVRVLGVATPATISLDPQATYAALAKSAGYASIGTAALFLLHERDRRAIAASVFAISAGLYAVYGVVGLAAGDCCVVWQAKTAYRGVATGPFINRNNFATFLGLAAVFLLGLLLRGWGDLRNVRQPSALATLLVRLQLLAAARPVEAVALPAVLAALLATQSRAGITASILGLSVLVFLCARAEVFGSSRKLLRQLLAFAAVVVVVLAFFGAAYRGRLANEGVEEIDRSQSWQIIVTGIEASPWLGHGFGTFPQAFPLYRDDRLASRRYWDKAQDTYLELALDTGIPATLVLLCGFAALVAQCWRGLARRRRERRVFPAIGIAATALVGAHAIYDFSMQIPAVATVYAVLMGLALTESGIWRGPLTPRRLEADIVHSRFSPGPSPVPRVAPDR